jgi:hypothetical protein
LPAEPGKDAAFVRDHEYVRHDMLSLLVGIDLLTGGVHARAEDRHRSAEFIAFLEQVDAAYPAATAIKPIRNNHSAHVSNRGSPPAAPAASNSSSRRSTVLDSG